MPQWTAPKPVQKTKCQKLNEVTFLRVIRRNFVKFGYARVSTQAQDLQLQLDALDKYGVERIYTEKISGTIHERPELERMLDSLREGDTVVVYSLSRLGRSLKQLIQITERFDESGVNLVSLTDQIDTSSSVGRFLFHLMASLAQFERDLISDRTKAGLEVARARGRKGGRPQKDAKSIDKAIRLYESKSLRLSEIEEATGVSRSTLYRSLRRRKVNK